MNAISSRILLLLLVISMLLAACAPKTQSSLPFLVQATATQAPASSSGISFEGVWKVLDSGQVAAIGAGKVHLFYATSKTCLDTGQSYPIVGDRIGGDAGPRFQQEGDQIVLTYPNSDRTTTLRRMDLLPPACQDASQHVKDPVYHFEAFWNFMNEAYPFFKLRGVDWQAAHDANIQDIDSQTSDVSLKLTLQKMLDPLKDINTTADQAGSGPFPNYDFEDGWKSLGGALWMNLGKTYVKDSKWTDSGRILYGKLNNQVGYLFFMYLNLVQNEQNDTKLREDFDTVVKYVQGMKAVVIDLRAVQYRGDAQYGRLLAGYFAGQEHVAYTVQTLNEGQLVQVAQYSVKPNDVRTYQGQVYVLTSPLDFGGVEQTILAFKALPNVKLVGEPTAGCLSEPMVIPISAALNFSMSFQVISTPDHQVYEKTGIPPDIPVTMTLDQWGQGKDPMLDKVLALTQ